LRGMSTYGSSNSADFIDGTLALLPWWGWFILANRPKFWDRLKRHIHVSYVYTHMHTSSYIYADIIHTYLPIYLCKCIYDILHIYMLYVWNKTSAKTKNVANHHFSRNIAIDWRPIPQVWTTPHRIVVSLPIYAIIYTYVYIYISVFLYVCCFTGLLFFNTPTMMLRYISHYMLILRRLYPSKRFVLHHNSF
jgi:hypothetical protein